MFSRIRTFARQNLDFFTFQVVPRHIDYHSGYSSWFGVAASVCMLTIVLSYSAFSIARFFTAPPSTSVRQSPTEDELHSINPTCIRVPHLNNKSWFGLAAKRIDLDARGRRAAETILNFTEIDPNTACLLPEANGNEAYVKSFCNPGLCSTVKIKLWYCGSPDKQNPARATTNCAPATDLVSLLEFNFVDVEYYSEVQGNTTLKTFPKANATLGLQSVFAFNRTISPPDLLTRFATHEIKQLQNTLNQFSVQRYYSPNVWPPYSEQMEIVLCMSPHTLVTSLTVLTSLDVASLAGAFASLVFSLFSVVFMRLNKYFFYKETPMWAYVGDDFTVNKAALNQQREDEFGGSPLVDQNENSADDNNSSSKTMLSRMVVSPSRKKVQFFEGIEPEARRTEAETEMRESSEE